MSKNKAELEEEIVLLKELLSNKDSISSEYKSYSDNFEKKIIEVENKINKTLEDKLSKYKDDLDDNMRLNYFTTFVFMLIMFGCTWVFAQYVFR